MDDLTLVTAFERGILTAFPHRDHVRVAWILIEREGYHGAVETMTAGIRRMAIAAGLLAKYHETRTVAWMRLIDAARRDLPAADSTGFVDTHPDLLDHRVLDVHYSAETLNSPAARAGFVSPDRRALP